VYEKSVHKISAVEQMERRVEVCLERKIRVSNRPSFIKSIVAGDETRVSRNQSLIVATEDSEFTSSRKMSSGPVKHRNDARCFFRFFFSV